MFSSFILNWLSSEFNIFLSKRRLESKICATGVKATQSLLLELLPIHLHWDWFKVLLVLVPWERVRLQRRKNSLQLQLVMEELLHPRLLLGRLEGRVVLVIE